MDIPFEQLKAKYLSLPEDVQSAISSTDVAEELYEIGTSFGLRIDEMDALSKETGLVLLGVTHPDQYIASLTAKLPLSKDKAPAIAQAVNEKIFAPIRGAIIDMHKNPTAPTPTNLPIAPSDAPLNTVQAQMSGAFRMAPDSVTLKGATPIPKPAPIAPVREGKYTSADPYREPTN